MSDDQKSGIIRVVKTGGFTVLDNTAANDERLSFKAVGIHTYLMTKPDDWQVYGSHLAKTHKDGRDAVYAGLKELEECGYLIRRVLRDESGKIVGRESVIFERPQAAPEKPSRTRGEPYSGKAALRESRVAENPELLNTDLPVKTDEQELLTFSPLRVEPEAPQPTGTLKERMLALKARKRDTTRTPSALHGEQVVGRAADDAERATPTAVKANAPKAPNPVAGPPSPAVPAGKPARKKAEKTAHPRHGEMWDAIKTALYGDVKVSNASLIGKEATTLLAEDLTPEDVPALVAWLRGLYTYRNPGGMPLKPYHLSSNLTEWRAAQKAPTGPRGSTKVADYLAEKYGEEELF
ncbi:hypothetical protein [Deinococcus aerophilus]|uniref:Helix-turn-helix domain-containing protein n=1 Tax=Deinococcus aerophilus TaxID=522488 RepID=A0ABQ2GVZ1_9DEIO|nr:hypothetical protein [Deinococcus aerophilus]GGM16325.1 hypothetical protein GCM10010841_25820 [Deinococcus aerophilus]